jgi:nucleoside-diphosphate-sugar epimerase
MSKTYCITGISGYIGRLLTQKLAQDFKKDHPEIQLVILRPCVLIGPHINNPTGDSLNKKY